VKNGDFKQWSGGADKASNGWILIENIPAVVTRDKTSAKVGRYSVQLTTANINDTGHISLHQLLTTKSLAGKTVTFGAWIKTNSAHVGNLQIVDTNWSCINSTGSGPHPGDGEWQFMTATGSIPEDSASEIMFMLRTYFQYTPE